MGTEAITPLAEGRYQLLEPIGSGGMATVYRAFDTRLQVPRAIKLLLPNLADRPKLRARFEAEAHTMAQLDHRHIVRVFDVGADGNRVYIVMELVEGGSLVSRIERSGALHPRQAVDACIDILRALELAHARGVIHRDIKPHNVLLTDDGEVKVTDFGIARINQTAQDSLTKTGAVMGTWAYMAPEQRANAKGVDVRADLYSVGGTLFTLLTRETPMDLFAADLDAKMLEGIPEPLAGVIKRATRYMRDERYGSAREMAQALRQVREMLPPLPPDAIPLSVNANVGADFPYEDRGGSFPAGPPSSQVPDRNADTRIPSEGPVPTMVPDASVVRSAPTLDSLGADSSPSKGEASRPSDVPLSSSPPPGLESIFQEPAKPFFRRHARWLVTGGVGTTGILVLGMAVFLIGTRAENPDPSADGPMIVAPVLPPEIVPLEVTPPVTGPTEPIPDPIPPTVVPIPISKPLSPPLNNVASPPTKPPGVVPVVTPTTPAPPPPTTTSPTLSHTPVGSASAGSAVTFRATINGGGNYQVNLYYRPATAGAAYQRRRMTGDGTSFSTTVTLDDSYANGVQYHIAATSEDPSLPKLEKGSGFSPYTVKVQ